MNSIGIALAWCVLQVTLVSLLTGLLYVIIRRFRPAASMPALLSGIAIIAMLSFMAFSSQPRWMHFLKHSSDSILDKSSSSEARVKAVPDVAKARAMDSPDAESYSSAHPSNLLILWQIANEEIFNLHKASIKSGWRWPATFAVFLFAAMALEWVILALSAARRQRFRGQAVEDAELLEILDVLRAELSCLTPIELRLCDDLVTAATIGWKRPAILLPAE
jgi:hypothetical protein